MRLQDAARRVRSCRRICEFAFQSISSSHRTTLIRSPARPHSCNADTMGWNCECNDGADSRLQPLTVPINTYGTSKFSSQFRSLELKRIDPRTDCRLRTAACLDQCSNPNGSPPVTNQGQCKNACNYILVRFIPTVRH